MNPSPWTVMRPVQGRIRLAMSLSALASLLQLVSLVALAEVLRALLAGGSTAPALIAATASTVAFFVLRIAAFNQSHYAAFRLETLLRSDLAAHAARVSLGELQRLGAATLAKLMYDDVKALHVFVADSTPLVARAVVAPLASMLALLWLDWRLGLAAGAVVLLGLLVMSLAMRNRGEMVQRYNAAREQVSAAVIEYVQAMPVVRSFDTGRSTFGRYQQALERYLDMLQQWYAGASFSARFGMAAMSALPTLAVLLALGLWLQQQGRLDAVTWVAVLMLGAGVAEAMLPLMTLMHLVDKTMLSVRRLQQVLALPVLPEPRADKPRTDLDASVRFEAVDFRYEAGSAAPTLAQISFCAEPGTVTALVGPSGAGKTTVARLIPRFWDVDTGCVRVGGADVRSLSADALMAQLAFVFQDTFLFAGSLADNIRLGRPEASLDEVQAAARAAQAHDFIAALPQGYDTPAGDRGVFLSGGQRQRITIARAILQNRPILVLDEATAFADPENEAALVQALSALMRGKTVIMVAHRLSTIRDADQILVMDRGRIVERGRHAQLLAQHGLYARLWASHEQAQHWALRTSQNPP
jgi:ATP-binding cassette, subfamily B, bacterial IrtA/YbtP